METTDNHALAADSIPTDCVYPVVCDCGWFGMREDCRRGMCPNCGDRVTRIKEGKDE